MTLDLGENTVKFLPYMSNRLRDMKVQDFLENGRFNLESIGQGQLVIHHLSLKKNQTKLPKNISDFLLNEKI